MAKMAKTSAIAALTAARALAADNDRASRRTGV